MNKIIGLRDDRHPGTATVLAESLEVHQEAGDTESAGLEYLDGGWGDEDSTDSAPRHTTHRKTTLRVAFTDAKGQEHHSTTTTTLSREYVQARSGRVRQGIDAFYLSIGCVCTAAQVDYEEGELLGGVRAAPVLSLIRGGVDIRL